MSPSNADLESDFAEKLSSQLAKAVLDTSHNNKIHASKTSGNQRYLGVFFFQVSDTDYLTTFRRARYQLSLIGMLPAFQR